MSNKNIKFFGEGSLNGGDLENVTCFGDLTIHDDITIENLKVFGALDVKGKYSGKEVKVYGSGSYDKDVNIDSVKIYGDIETRGIVKTKHLRVYGAIENNDNIKGDDIRIYGYAKSNNIDSETLKVNGLIELDGIMNVNRVEFLNKKNRSFVNEIVGSTIINKPKRKWYMFKSKFTNLEVNTIEADYIELTNTRAKLVRGEHVIIGPNCVIEQIEYSNTLEVDSSSIVNSKIKL